MSTHKPEKVTLTKAERETLLNALWDDGCHGFGSDHTHWPTAVESIIAARLAPVLALADQFAADQYRVLDTERDPYRQGWRQRSVEVADALHDALYWPGE